MRASSMALVVIDVQCGIIDNPRAWRAAEVLATIGGLAARARAAGVPSLAVDTPTAVDHTSGDLADPVVRAHVTVTFHRPKTGLLARRGAAVAA